MALGKKWISCHLKSEDLEQISQTVKEAETKTTGEIIPMVVRSSTPVGHIPLLVALTIFASLLLIEFDLAAWFTQDWGIQDWYLYPVYFVISILMGLFLASFPTVQRFFLSTKDQQFEVEERAELEFYRGKFHRTKERTGILIFVSILERRVVVLGDQSIASKLDKQTWDEVVQIMIAEKKQGRLNQAFIKGIQRCGEILAQHFPAQQKNPNEISNQLIIKE